MHNTQTKTACKILAGRLHKKKGYLGDHGTDANTETK
jgi:hypothetical protein